MTYIKDKNEIKKHMILVDRLIDRKKTQEFVYENIFNKKFKYLLFVDGWQFGEYVIEGLEQYLSERNEVDFYVNGLTEDRHTVHYSFDSSNEIGYKNLMEGDEMSPHDFFMGLDNVCLEYLYYTKTENWCGWIDIVWEIGIFAFETKALAKSFMEKFDRILFFTPKEVTEQIWSTPKEELKEAFLKNYKSFSYNNETVKKWMERMSIGPKQFDPV